MIGRLIDNAEDREELCQDVFLKVHEKLKEFNFQSRLSTWIATIGITFIFWGVPAIKRIIFQV